MANTSSPRGTGVAQHAFLRRALLGALCLAFGLVGAAESHVAVELGEVFPDLEFELLIDSGDYAKLGLARPEGPFRLSEIPGEVLVLEFFNKSCVPCQTQVRNFQAFYQNLRSQGLGNRIRVLAIGAGNKAKYLPRYRRKRRLSYPITADPQFDQWRRLGEPGRTPFTVFLLRRDGAWVYANSHFGIQEQAALMAESVAYTEGFAGVAQTPPAEPPPAQPAKPPIDLEAQRRLAAALFSRAAGTRLDAAKVDLPGWGTVFRAVDPVGERRWYARVGSREPVCEVCHAVHFLYAFTADGRVLGYEPIHVTKYNNREWTRRDNTFFDARVRGRHLGELDFDPEVDAVSSATMSSALIFDEMRRTAPLLELLAVD